MKKQTLFIVSTLVILSILFGLSDSVQHIEAKKLHQVPVLEILVTTTDDLIDFQENGVCSAHQPVDGPCSLRAAIFEASKSELEVIIYLPPGEYVLSRSKPDYPGQPEDQYGDLDIPDSEEENWAIITIKGTGLYDNPSIINGNFTDRILHIGERNTVSLENIVIKNGYVDNEYDGGGVYILGSILELTHVRITQNKLKFGSTPSSQTQGGGIFGRNSNIKLNYCEIDHNEGQIGSAISVSTGQIFKDSPQQIYNTSIHHNVIEDSTWSHLYVISPVNNASFVNVTVADNFAADGNSGINMIVNGETWISHSTLIATGKNPNIEYEVWERGDLKIYASIVANLANDNGETGTNCVVYDMDQPSMGDNFFTDKSCRPKEDTDFVLDYEDLFLEPLADNGGYSPTIALGFHSPVINATNDSCYFYDYKDDIYYEPEPPILPLHEDQRAVWRDDGKCDSGAFEQEPTWRQYLPVMVK